MSQMDPMDPTYPPPNLPPAPPGPYQSAEGVTREEPNKQATKSGFRKRGLIALGGLFTLLIAVGIVVVILGKNTSSPAPTANNDLQLLEWKSESESRDGFSFNWVTGSICNNSTRMYTYVEITFIAYDASGEKLGSTIAIVKNLAPEDVQEFRAPVWQDNVSELRVKEIWGR